ncbi:hypothetical protein NX059_012241 [Plenodomus lindquistii]|nr:hypothetical protein NX059_012241 [Plenodomus lindquistii]
MEGQRPSREKSAQSGDEGSDGDGDGDGDKGEDDESTSNNKDTDGTSDEDPLDNDFKPDPEADSEGDNRNKTEVEDDDAIDPTATVSGLTPRGQPAKTPALEASSRTRHQVNNDTGRMETSPTGSDPSPTHTAVPAKNSEAAVATPNTTRQPAANQKLVGSGKRADGPPRAKGVKGDCAHPFDIQLCPDNTRDQGRICARVEMPPILPNKQAFAAFCGDVAIQESYRRITSDLTSHADVFGLISAVLDVAQQTFLAALDQVTRKADYAKVRLLYREEAIHLADILSLSARLQLDLTHMNVFLADFLLESEPPGPMGSLVKSSGHIAQVNDGLPTSELDVFDSRYDEGEDGWFLAQGRREICAHLTAHPGVRDEAVQRKIRYEPCMHLQETEEIDSGYVAIRAIVARSHRRMPTTDQTAWRRGEMRAAFARRLTATLTGDTSPATSSLWAVLNLSSLPLDRTTARAPTSSAQAPMTTPPAHTPSGRGKTTTTHAVYSVSSSPWEHATPTPLPRPAPDFKFALKHATRLPGQPAATPRTPTRRHQPASSSMSGSRIAKTTSATPATHAAKRKASDNIYSTRSNEVLRQTGSSTALPPSTGSGSQPRNRAPALEVEEVPDNTAWLGSAKKKKRQGRTQR